MTDDTLNPLQYNTHVETGLPVTKEDEINHERVFAKEGMEKWLENESKKELSNTDTGAEIKQMMLQDVTKGIEDQIAEQANNGGKKASWFSNGAIQKCNPVRLADMTLSVVLDGTRKEWTLRHLTEELGNAFACMVFAETFAKTASGRRMIARLDKNVTSKTQDGVRRRKIVLEKAKKYGFDADFWDANECSKIGHVLLNAVLMMENYELIEIVREKRLKDSHITRYPVFTEGAQKMIEEQPLLFAHFHSTRPPMIYPPREWSVHNIGPYLAPELMKLTPVVRNTSPDQSAELDKRMDNLEFEDAFDALNFIQNTPYTINKYVLEALHWLHGNLDVAKKVDNFPEIEKIPEIEKLDTEEFKKLSKDEQMDRHREYSFRLQYNRTVTSNLVNLSTRIGVANYLTDYEKFWLPHNFDYRGRIYHIPDFGHHHTDNTRALFLFANKKPIGENVKELKRQIANTYGKDKLPIAERCAWVDEHSDEIYAVGQDFKASFDFWSVASDPMAFLAACHEWYNYKNEGPSYASGLPVALDATQSGQQHYSAASLNPVDAEKVNILPNEKPFDFYEACLIEAKKLISLDLQKQLKDRENNPWTDEEKQVLEDHQAFQLQPYPEDLDEAMALDEAKAKDRKQFKETTAYKKQNRDRDISAAQAVLAMGDQYDRKVIKRNAMTFGYSSRKFGFAEQLRDDWMLDFTKKVASNEIEEHPFGADNGYHAAFYLGTLHEKAIRNTVKSTEKGMDFLRGIAEILADDLSKKDIRELDALEKAMTDAEMALSFATDEEKKEAETKAKAATREYKARLKKLEGRHFKFINKMGFPFFQFYRVGSTKSQKTFLFDRKVREYNKKNKSYYRNYTDKVKKDKSQDGISPNLIHCQDGCHLMKTALGLKKKGVTDFMVIHDSFATTIADTPILNQTLREEFFNLYDGYCLYQDVLEQAKAVHSAPDTVEWPSVPDKGQDGVLLDLSVVLDSPNFFN